MTKYYVMIWLKNLNRWDISNKELTLADAQVIKQRAENNGKYAKIGGHSKECQMKL